MCEPVPGLRDRDGETGLPVESPGQALVRRSTRREHAGECEHDRSRVVPELAGNRERLRRGGVTVGPELQVRRRGRPPERDRQVCVCLPRCRGRQRDHRCLVRDPRPVERRREQARRGDTVTGAGRDESDKPRIAQAVCDRGRWVGTRHYSRSFASATL